MSNKDQFKIQNVRRAKVRGFTLIELLVVILIIGTLSGIMLSVLNTAGLRQKARDSQRVADLKKVQTALELYFADYRGYPLQTSWDYVPNVPSILVSNGYISVLPTDPSGISGSSAGITPCSSADANGDGTKDYYYSYITDNPGASATVGTKYVLTARMELPADNTNSCASLGNWSGALSCSPIPADVYCYGAQNP